MTIPAILENHLNAALSETVELGEFRGAVTVAADLRFGDYQTNAAMILAKIAKQNPRALAEKILARLGELVGKIAEVSIAGPGFINFKIKPSAYASKLSEILKSERLDVDEVEDPKTIVVDFSAPNVAKPMHVGHIRSTIIGDALARLARFLGHNVITDNHIGDWGTQFGMILWGWKNKLDSEALAQNPIEELLRLYKDVNDCCKADSAVLDACKKELVKLQAGDAENRKIWEKCVAVSKSGLGKIYDQLEVRFDHWLGESFYNESLAPLVEEMLAKEIAVKSDGAICVFSDKTQKPENDPFLIQRDGEWRDNPSLIRKADGGFLYATTDLATIDYRAKEWKADEIWYVVGAPQALHFRQIFSIARRRGQMGEMKHIAFGSILGEDRKPFKTRSGDTVSLQDVLDEAIERSEKIISEKNPDIQGDERREVARIVGLGAVKFAELSQHRLTDYVFSWEKMLALQGDTAPYLQYSYVRVRSIFRKLEAMPDFAEIPAEFFVPSHDAERELLRILTRYAEVVPAVLEDFRPNLLAHFLLEIARAFHSFFEACPVLKAEEPARTLRLGLCEAVARTLNHGLDLLGISTPEKM